MEIRIVPGLKQWYGLPVVISRGADRVILVQKPDFEIPEMVAKKSPEDTLTADQKRELFFIASHPSEAKIAPSGGLAIPHYLEEWLQQEGQLRFRGNDERILIDRSRCLCDSPTCAKCLGGNCKDPICPVHRQTRKAAFAKRIK